MPSLKRTAYVGAGDRRTLQRLAHEIVEKTGGTKHLALIGIGGAASHWRSGLLWHAGH